MSRDAFVRHSWGLSMGLPHAGSIDRALRTELELIRET